MRFFLFFLIVCIPGADLQSACVCKLTELEEGRVESSKALVTKEADLQLPFRSAHLLHTMAKRGQSLCVFVSYKVDRSGTVSDVKIIRSNLPERILMRVVVAALNKFDHDDFFSDNVTLFYFFYYDLRKLGYGDG